MDWIYSDERMEENSMHLNSQKLHIKNRNVSHMLIQQSV